MKFLPLSLVLSIIYFSVFAQTNSVRLKSITTIISHHNSITEAYNTISANGLTQQFFIELLPAYDGSDEVYPIHFYAIPGMSPGKAITLRPAAGNDFAVISADLPDLSIIYFDECDYVNIDGRAGGQGEINNLTIENKASVGFGTETIYFYHASNSSIIYCNIIAYTQEVSPFTPANISFTNSYWNPKSSSHHLFENCRITGGGFGIVFDGFRADSSNAVRKCQIENFGRSGIFIAEPQYFLTIEDNVFEQKHGYNQNSVSAIMGNPSDYSVITRNRIFDLATTYSGNTAVRGIYLYLREGRDIDVTNNFISLKSDNPNLLKLYGIEINGEGHYYNRANVYHNTVYLGGEDTVASAPDILSACMIKTSTGYSGVYNIKNNIFMNKRSGGNETTIHTGGVVKDLSGVINVEYNLYHSSGSQYSYQAGWLNNYYNDLAQFKAAAAPAEANAVFKWIPFASTNDLHLTNASWQDPDLKAYYIYEVSTDIDEETRSWRYKGADEMLTPLPVELTGLSASVENSSVILNWKTSTELNNLGFEVERNFENNGWITAGFVKGRGNSTEQLFYTFVDKDLSAGTYNYRIRQTDYNGTFTFYTLVEPVIVVPSFFISQNYPNPFNPVTTINYSIPTDGLVKIIVYDAIGREAAILVNREQPHGNYSIEFNAHNLSSGIYYYRIIAGEFNEMRKMVLLR
jgi:hypothetical protein